MAADDDHLDLEVGDGVLDDGGGAEVVGVKDVGDVAVHEDVAGLAVADGGLGYPRVGASYPQDLGRLALGERLEELRRVRLDPLREASVAG